MSLPGVYRRSQAGIVSWHNVCSVMAKQHALPCALIALCTWQACFLVSTRVITIHLFGTLCNVFSSVTTPMQQDAEEQCFQLAIAQAQHQFSMQSL